jgi:hypothetical protein
MRALDAPGIRMKDREFYRVAKQEVSPLDARLEKRENFL